MKKVKVFYPLPVVLVMIATFIFFPACMGKQAKKPSPTTAQVPCMSPEKLVTKIVPDAKLLEFGCYFGKYKKVDSLFFKLTVKNVSNTPKRFRVNIFLDNGKAVGGLIPRKGKPPVLKPGEAKTVKYPVKGMNKKPGGITLFIKTASY